MKWAIWVNGVLIGSAKLDITDKLYRFALENTPNMGVNFGPTSVRLTNTEYEEREDRARDFDARR
jgi:hypothetical protein